MLEISADGVRARIHLQGGMVTAAFDVGGATVEPLYEAPWLGRWSGDSLLEHLRGDFACVPFGMPGHGYSANHAWRLVERADDAATLAIDYPAEHAVERVTRTLRCVGGALEFEDAIELRVEAALPLGLHPMFRLPGGVGAVSLELPAAEAILTPPTKPEPSSRLLPGQRFTDPKAAPSTDGAADLTRLPWEGNSEDLVLLADVAEGRVAVASSDERYRAVLEWETELLRHCLLWVSNRGRDFEPWDGRNLCLGVEPVTSAFDLGVEASVGENPVSAQGFQTAVPLVPGEPHVIRHRISVG